MYKRQNGFTIVELVIVIVVIGILSAIAIVSFSGVAKQASNAVVKSDARSLVGALGIYGVSNADLYVSWFSGNPLPAGLDAKVSPGSYGDIVTSPDKKQYCIRVFNTKSSYTSAANAYTLEQPVGACAAFAASDDAIAATPITSGWKAVSNSCAIRYDSNVYCWGMGAFGRHGNAENQMYTNSNVPTPVSTAGVLAGKTIKSIASGEYATCAIASDDNAYCWGANFNGSSGNGTNDPAGIPTTVFKAGVLSGKTIKQIATNDRTVCAIASDNLGYCWGRNTSSQLGNGTTTDSNQPVAINTAGALSGKTLTSIAVGSDSTCAIASDGYGYCWGDGGSGTIGNGTGVGSITPAAIDRTGVLAGKTLKKISSAISHVCVIASDDNAYCWGYGNNGNLGDGNSISSAPVAVTNTGVLAGKTIKSISAGYQTTCAVASDNNAYCWGSNANGELGNGSNLTSSVPVAVNKSGVLLGKTIKSISVGKESVCAIASDNNAYCWGKNSVGDLGNGNNTTSNVPVLVTQP